MQKIIVGNWKMHKTIQEVEGYFVQFIPLVANSKALIGIAPPFTALKTASEEVAGTKIIIGAQNVHEQAQGAFTGEISLTMLQDVGVQFVLVGHSERRHIFHEENASLNKKLLTILQSNLKAIYCVGETLDQRQKGQTEKVIAEQLEAGLKGISAFKNLIIAYEPVWAIGTNLPATPEIVEEIHAFCKNYLAKQFGSRDIPILYGGSVNVTNAPIFLNCKHVDGLLVGGASLDPKTFATICNEGIK